MKCAVLILWVLVGLALPAGSQEIPQILPRLSVPQRQADTVRKVNPNALSVARLKYGGGGDWYWGSSAIPNLLQFIREQTAWPVDMEEKSVGIEDEELLAHPFLFATGHGTFRLTDSERERLRAYLLAGGFLFINDSYGLDASVRKAVAELFPEKKFEEIPFDHPIYHSFFDFPNGPPKIHEHDKKAPTGWGISVDGRLVLYYLHESDIGDGWEDPQVHNDPSDKRQEALKMGLNIVTYSLMH
jgi:hypothetical protein